MAAQNITPVQSTQSHPDINAPAGTKRYTTASCNDGSGTCLVAYPLDAGPLNLTPVNGTSRPTGVRVRRVSAEQAAVDLAWAVTDENRAAPRLPTAPEEAAYYAAGGK